MYSVVEVKGHQYRVSPGDIIDVQKMGIEEGQTIEISDVLLVGGEKTIVGAPKVDGAIVKAKVVKNGRGKKIFMIRRTPRGWTKRKGHRQSFTGLLITEINDGQGNTVGIPSDHKNAKKA